MTVTPGQGLHIDLAGGGDYKKVYQPSKRRLALVKGALGLTTGAATLLFILIRTGTLTPQPGHANDAGLLGSALLMISCLLIIVLRERVILTTDYVESRLLFTSRLHVSDIKGWRLRLPNGSDGNPHQITVAEAPGAMLPHSSSNGYSATTADPSSRQTNRSSFSSVSVPNPQRFRHSRSTREAA